MKKPASFSQAKILSSIKFSILFSRRLRRHHTGQSMIESIVGKLVTDDWSSLSFFSLIIRGFSQSGLPVCAAGEANERMRLQGGLPARYKRSLPSPPSAARRGQGCPHLRRRSARCALMPRERGARARARDFPRSRTYAR